MGIKTFYVANPTVKQVEVYTDFTGGLNTEQADNKMRDNQFRELVNFDFDKAGSLTKRPGLKKVAKLNDAMYLELLKIFPIGELVDLEVLDTQQFFDGLNWIFNYITNKGLCVVILNKNLEVEVDVDGNIVKQDKNFRFYPDIKDNIKISSYSDYYVMMTSKYETESVAQDGQRQVKLYSWNPIPDLEYETPDKDESGKPIIVKYDKQWVEASASQEENPSATYYGDTISETTSSVSKLPIPMGVNTLDIKVTPYDDSEQMFSFLLRFDLTVTYMCNDDGTSPIMEFRWTNRTSTGRLEKKVYSVPINIIGRVILDKDIHQMTSKIDSYSCSFSYYIPSINTILTYSLKIPTSGNTIDIEGTLRKLTFVKTAFKRVRGINSGTQRARNFLLSKEGVPCDITIKDVYTINGEDSIIRGVSVYSSVNMFNPFDPRVMTETIASDFVRNEVNATQTKYNGLSDSINEYSESFNYYQLRTRATAINQFDYDNINAVARPGLGLIAPYDGGGAVMYPSNPSVDSAIYTGFISELGMTPSPFWKVGKYPKPGLDLTDLRYNRGDFFIPSVELTNPVYKGNYHVNNISNMEIQKSYSTLITTFDDPKKSSIIFPYETTSISNLNRDNVMIEYNAVSWNLFAWSQISQSENKHSDYISGTDSRGFAFGQGSAIITSGVNVYNFENFYFSGLMGNNLNVFNPNKKDNWINCLLLNDKLDLIKDASVPYGWKPFLGDEGYQDLRVVSLLRQQGKLLNLKLTHTATKADGSSIVLQSVLRQNQLFLLLDYILGVEDPLLTVFYIQADAVKALDYKVTSGSYQQDLIFDAQSYPELTIDDYESVAKSLTFNFVYNYFENEASNSVVQFKKNVYQKPNLNDLKYIYYNFALFSKTANRTNPNIYSKTIHPTLSNFILEYPQKPSEDSLGIQGLVPINNLILLPGEGQKFQVLASFEGTSLTDIVCNVTVMKITDFISRNADKNFDTQKSLEWVPWDVQFPGASASNPNSSILTVDIPSSTDPYIVSVSIARLGKADDAGDRLIDTTTLRESQIEMSPQSSISQRIDIPALFDEFTSTTNMGIMETASALVAYGNSNKLFFSDIATPSYFPVSAVVPLKTPQSITSITMFQNKLIVSTANTRSYISGTSFDAVEPENRISVKEISSNSGTISPKAEIPFGDRLYFIDSNGVKYLQNLYGTSDKEFTYKQADALIKSIVPVYDTQACAVSYDEKLYVNFPSEKIMLVYHKNFDAWVMYESEFMTFANMFVNEGKLYAVSKNTFDIYSFDRDVMVDSWNEDIGYEVWEAPDGTKHNVQKGKPIRCSLQTKDLDQNYNPHQKKYKELLINATVTGTNGTIAPIIEVDSDQINYKFDYVLDGTNTLSYRELEPDAINLQSSSNINYDPKISNGSVSLSNMVVGNSILGNTKEVNYMLPIRRKGNVVSFNLVFDAPSLIMINSFSLIYSLAKIKKNRGGR